MGMNDIQPISISLDSPGDIELNQQSSSSSSSNPSGILRRNRPGTRIEDWCKWPDEELDEMESTLAVLQFIQQLIRKNPHDIEEILKSPEQQDEGVWKYEHLRQFCMELNLITVRLQQECTAATCSQMTATEQWIFLCAAHKNPKECSAIDYTRHTLDGAANLLNSNRYFPSRVNIKESSVQKLGSICRRIYRIFSHAYYHHRDIYDEFEKETSLCQRFTRFVIKYDLMTADALIVPCPGLDTPAAVTTTASSTSSSAASTALPTTMSTTTTPPQESSPTTPPSSAASSFSTSLSIEDNNSPPPSTQQQQQQQQVSPNKENVNNSHESDA